MVTAAPLYFEKQLAYFRQKVNVKTNSYLDVQGDEHDYLFMVAGANRNEVLGALRDAVSKAIEKGTTLEEFRKDFDRLVQSSGWTYKGGRNWRTRIIYDTNLYGSYNKGRLAQHLELKEVLPYWEYVHNDNAHPRPEHQSWNGKILPADDPWWTYHYPIKAYGCHCEVVAHSATDLQKMGRTVDKSPDIEWTEKLVGVRSGNPQMVKLPKGYDPGFAPHNFNKLWSDKYQSADKILFSKMVAAEPVFASLAIANVLDNAGALRMLNQSTAEMVQRVASEKIARGEMKYVGVVPADTIQKLERLGKAPQTAVIAVRDEDILHGLRDTKKAKNLNLPQEFWEQLPERLRNPSAILLDESQKQSALLFIYRTGQGKVVVKMDYEIKVKNETTGKKEKIFLNLVRTGSLLTKNQQWETLKDFQLLWGNLD